MMKQLFLNLVILGLPTMIMAQPNAWPAPRVETHVERVPLTREGPEHSMNVPFDQRGRYQANHGINGRQNHPSAPSIEQTLVIVKPDAVRNQHIGAIISRFEEAGLYVAAIKMVQLNPYQAGRFYQMHRNRPFFHDLVSFMSSGPIVVIALEGNQAVSKSRQLIGTTNPNQAERGTIRADLGQSVTQNAIHGSDSSEAARKEIGFFFRPDVYPPG